MAVSKSIREKWLCAYNHLEARGQALKDSQSVAFGLLEVYDSLTVGEQKELLPLLAEWLLSEDNKHRYDATFLAMERKIVELVPAITNTILRLEQVPGPEAKDEIEGLVELRKALLDEAVS